MDAGPYKRVLLKHTGTYVFDFGAQDSLYKSLHEMAQKSSAAPAPATSEIKSAEPKVLATNQVKPASKRAAAKKKS